MGMVIYLLVFLYFVLATGVKAGIIPLEIGSTYGPAQDLRAVSAVLDSSGTPLQIFGAGSGGVFMLLPDEEAWKLQDELSISDPDPMALEPYYNGTDGWLYLVTGSGLSYATFNATSFTSTSFTSSSDGVCDLVVENGVLWTVNGTHLRSVNASNPADSLGTFYLSSLCSSSLSDVCLVDAVTDGDGEVLVAVADTGSGIVCLVNGTDPTNSTSMGTISSVSVRKILLGKDASGDAQLFVFSENGSLERYSLTSSGPSVLGSFVGPELYVSSACVFSPGTDLWLLAAAGEEGIYIWDLLAGDDPVPYSFIEGPGATFRDLFCSGSGILAATELYGLVGYSLAYPHRIRTLVEGLPDLDLLFTYEAASSTLEALNYNQGTPYFTSNASLPLSGLFFEPLRDDQEPHMLAVGTRIFLARPDKLYIYDYYTSNSTFSLQGSLNLAGLPITSLTSASDENYVYVAYSRTIRTLNATDPASPALLTRCATSLDTNVEALAAFVYQGQDYLAVLGDDQLYIFPGCNFTAPEDPWLPLGNLSLNQVKARDISVDNRTDALYFYLTGEERVLTLVNATDPASPHLIVSLPTEPLGATAGHRIVLYRDNATLPYVLVGTDRRLLVFSVNATSVPTLVAQAENSGRIYDLFVDESLEQAILTAGSLYAIDLSSLSTPPVEPPSLSCSPSNVVFSAPDTPTTYVCNATSSAGIYFLGADLWLDGFYEAESSSGTLSFSWAGGLGVSVARVEAFDSFWRPAVTTLYRVVSQNCGATNCESGKLCGCFVPMRKEKGAIYEVENFRPGDNFNILYCSYAHNYTVTQKHDLYLFLEAGGRWFVLRPDGWIRWEDFEETSLGPYASLQNELSEEKPYCVSVAEGKIPDGLGGAIRFYAVFVGEGESLAPDNLKSNIAVLEITISP